MECYSAIKNYEFEACIGKRLYFKTIMLIEINQTQKFKYCIASLI